MGETMWTERDEEPETRAASPQPEGGESALRAELASLSEEVRSLRSPDLAARAYAESWLALVAGSVGVKLLVDSSRVPYVAWPLLFMALLLVVDIVRVRGRRRALAAVEEQKLARQRELRSLLGLDELSLN